MAESTASSSELGVGEGEIKIWSTDEFSLDMGSYKCNICHHKFKHQHVVKRHIDAVHNKEHSSAKVSCSICNQVFSRKDHLTAHMRRHTGDRPYTCSICSQKFYQSSNCKRHLERAHNVSPSMIKSYYTKQIGPKQNSREETSGMNAEEIGAKSTNEPTWALPYSSGFAAYESNTSSSFPGSHASLSSSPSVRMPTQSTYSSNVVSSYASPTYSRSSIRSRMPAQSTYDNTASSSSYARPSYSLPSATSRMPAQSTYDNTTSSSSYASPSYSFSAMRSRIPEQSIYNNTATFSSYASPSYSLSSATSRRMPAESMYQANLRDCNWRPQTMMRGHQTETVTYTFPSSDALKTKSSNDEDDEDEDDCKKRNKQNPVKTEPNSDDSDSDDCKLIVC